MIRLIRLIRIVKLYKQAKLAQKKALDNKVRKIERKRQMGRLAENRYKEPEPTSSQVSSKVVPAMESSGKQNLDDSFD